MTNCSIPNALPDSLFSNSTKVFCLPYLSAWASLCRLGSSEQDRLAAKAGARKPPSTRSLDHRSKSELAFQLNGGDLNSCFVTGTDNNVAVPWEQSPYLWHVSSQSRGIGDILQGWPYTFPFTFINWFLTHAQGPTWLRTL